MSSSARADSGVRRSRLAVNTVRRDTNRSIAAEKPCQLPRIMTCRATGYAMAPLQVRGFPTMRRGPLGSGGRGMAGMP